MKKILIILTGVLLVYSEPVMARDLTGIELAKKVTKVKVKKKKVSKKYKSVKKKK